MLSEEEEEKEQEEEEEKVEEEVGEEEEEEVKLAFGTPPHHRPQSPWRDDTQEVKGETGDTTIFPGNGSCPLGTDHCSRLPGTRLCAGLLFLHTEGRGFHVTILLRKLQGWLYRNFLAKYEGTRDLHNKNEFY